MNRDNKQRMLSLMLAMLMFLNGCSDRFRLTENKNSELVAVDDSYIDNSYIVNYVVLEVYNKILGENEIFIVKTIGVVDDVYYCSDVFTNLDIAVGDNSSMFEYVKETSLSDYIILYGLGQKRYSYDDMKNIYEVIKENYVFESEKSLRKVRFFDNRF